MGVALAKSQSRREGERVMTKQEAIRLRRMLYQRRQQLFNRLRQIEAHWQALGERDIELEEEAQKTDLTSLFDRLDEQGKMEIEEIDLALRKMAVGEYGICESCRNRITLKRLETLPTARLCRKCVRKYEIQEEQLPLAREVMTAAELPPEYQGLTDRQLRIAILDQLRNDGRVDLEELKIFCRKGIVYLEGMVPSEGEHQILLQILTDIMGLTAIIDHVQINEIIWEREDRAPGAVVSGISENERLLYSLEEFTEDVFESQEEGLPYSPADRPLPEEK
jgi:DnaK suppressor protein